ncbi:hypothetical protein Sliba_26360 [Streptomyces nigrescens]|uniref:Uncharacterized protein n=1 Tax=Streptomyces nigrescens TaxID=1920 RepID=A0A640TEI4_STRNI|nr:hypothetical protein Sliba_26360 [Streptomyces libani subsp. libani]GGV90240.1 hypothetical protein GCM10010500_17180 [Streptomyces libani subsp. libani]
MRAAAVPALPVRNALPGAYVPTMPETGDGRRAEAPGDTPPAPAVTAPRWSLRKAPEVVEPMGNERPPRWAWLDAKGAPLRGFRGSAKGKEPQGTGKPG